MSIDIDIRETNRNLARLASIATVLDARARRAQARADGAHREAKEAWEAWHGAWKEAAHAAREPAPAGGDGGHEEAGDVQTEGE